MVTLLPGRLKDTSRAFRKIVPSYFGLSLTTRPPWLPLICRRQAGANRACFPMDLRKTLLLVFTCDRDYQDLSAYNLLIYKKIL